MNREPSVVRIVDRILELDQGDSCDIKLDPHMTRIGNMEWLLPICVQQFGTKIAIREHPEGDDVVLTITATEARKHKACQPAGQAQPTAEQEDQPAVGEESQLAVVA